MKALLWKEARELTWPFGVFLVLYSVLAAAGQLWPGEQSPPKTAFMVAWVVWWLLSPFLAALWGAHALARERSHGTLEWFGALPVSRRRAWAVKLGVSLALLAVFCAVMFELNRLMGYWWPAPKHANPNLFEPFWFVLVPPFLFFCVGFAISGTRRQTFESVLVTVLAVLLLTGAWALLAADVLPRFWGPQLGIIYNVLHLSTLAWLSGTLGAAFLVASAVGWMGVPLLSSGRRYRRTAGWAAGLAVLGTMGFVVGVRYLGQPQPGDMRHLGHARTSPDGEWIAFDDQRRGDLSMEHDAGLWVMRPDGTDLRCLARGPVQDWVWETDSQRVLFTWGNVFTPDEILPELRLWLWDAQVANGRLRRLAEAEADVRVGQDLSSRGEHARFGPHFLRLGSRPGLVAAQLPESARFRGWGPNNSGFFFSTEEGRRLGFAAFPDGAVLSLETAPPETDFAEVSPDGEWMVYVTYPTSLGSRPEQQSARLARRGQTVVMRIPSIPWLPDAWSPDGRYLWLHKTRGTILVVDLSGPQIVREIPILRGDNGYDRSSLFWSADGRRVAFSTQAGREPAFAVSVWTAQEDGTELKQVAQVVSGYYGVKLAGWTRDGRLIMVRDQTQIVAVDPDTGQQTALLTLPPPAHRGTPPVPR